MGLSELVQGYVKGQELKMKKSREVADKTAEEFSRQFKVQQAQTEAAQQEVKNRQEQQRVDTEAKYAQTAADKADADKSHKEHMDLIAEKRIELQRDIAGMKIDFSDYSQKMKRRAKIYDDLRKERVPPDLAAQGADQILNDEVSAFEQRKSAQQSAGQPPAQGNSILSGTGNPLAQPQSPGQTGNPIMDALHAMHGHNVQAPIERPDFLSQMTPKQQADALLEQSKRELQDSARRKNDAIADLSKQDAALTKQMLQARVALTKKQNENLDSEIKHRKNMEPHQIAELQARTIEIQTHSQAEIRNADVSAMREQRLQLEADIKNDPNSGTAKNKLLANLDKARTAHLRLNEEIIKSVAHAASLSDKFAKAQKENDIATMKTAAGMQAAVANQLSELRNAHTEAYKNYISAQSAVKEFGLKEVTSPSGGAAHRANDADTRAVNSARRSADRIRPVPILPPGAPIVPGSQPGLYARPRTPDAPKKKIEKKKGKVVYDNGGITIREK